jgi:glycosyltransferase involved in cell wall biosynthesis
MDGLARLTVGMPVRNGEKHIGIALDSLLKQSYRDWRLLISDNASTDDTRRICLEYCNRDPRVSYVRQSTDIGQINNFAYLISKATTEYFAWAASDDVWHEEFLAAAASALLSNPEAGLFFCSIKNIDDSGRCVRNYPPFARFVSDDPYVSLVNFLLDPEIMGKANLWYGVMRLAGLKSYVLDFLSSSLANNYASDCAMILGVLCRARFLIDERVLFYKRIPVGGLSHKRRSYHIPTIMIEGYGWCDQYRRALEYACRNTKFEKFVVSVLHFREKVDRDVRYYHADSLSKLVRLFVRESLKYARSVVGRLRRKLIL